MREELAALMHEVWAHWMKYLFEQCERGFDGWGDGSAVIPEGLVERWKRQINTPYDELSEKEKDSDRHQADKVLALTGEICTTVDRLIGNIPATCEILRSSGRVNLAGQMERDRDNLVYWRKRGGL